MDNGQWTMAHSVYLFGPLPSHSV